MLIGKRLRKDKNKSRPSPVIFEISKIGQIFSSVMVRLQRTTSSSLPIIIGILAPSDSYFSKSQMSYLVSNSTSIVTQSIFAITMITGTLNANESLK